MSEPLSEQAAETLLSMVERSGKVSAKTTPELAQILIDLAGEHLINSYTYLVLMEAAYRLAPEIFEEQDETK